MEHEEKRYLRIWQIIGVLGWPVLRTAASHNLLSWARA